MVAYATLIDGTKISAARFIASVSWVGFNKKREVEDLGMLRSEACRICQNMIYGGPCALVFVGARLELCCLVGQDSFLCERLELWSVLFSVEVSHDDEVGLLSGKADGVDVAAEGLHHLLA